MAEPQDRVEEISAPPVFTSTLDGVPYADDDYGYRLKGFSFFDADDDCIYDYLLRGPYASYGSSSNSYSHNAHPQSAYSQTPNRSYAPQYRSYGGPPPQSKKTLNRKYSQIADNYQSIDEVTEALTRAGLESSNLILGIDFTKSNEWTGARSFHRKSLHHIGDEQNPYEQAISIIGRSLSNSSPVIYECAPPSPAFTEELFPANSCYATGKAVEAIRTRSDGFKRIFSFFDLGTDSGFGPRRPRDDIWGISAPPSDAGFDLELGGISDTGGILTHLLRAERNASYNQELLSYKQWRAYIEDCKIVNSGARDSMLIQPVITLLGEAFGGALAYTLNGSSKPSQINTLVRASILIGVGLTVAGIGLRRFKRRLSDNMMKAGAMGTALAIIVAFADLLPPWLAWSVGAATSILVAAGLALI